LFVFFFWPFHPWTHNKKQKNKKDRLPPQERDTRNKNNNQNNNQNKQEDQIERLSFWLCCVFVCFSSDLID
jgi:hypothetical protein